jgi:hypothetical protein
MGGGREQGGCKGGGGILDVGGGPFKESRKEGILGGAKHMEGQPTRNPMRQQGHRAAMAGLGNNPVQVFATGLPLHWEFLRFWTGFELPSSWTALPCYGLDLNRNSFCVMR